MTAVLSPHRRAGLRVALAALVGACFLLLVYRTAPDVWVASHFGAAAVIFFAAADSTRSRLAAILLGAFCFVACLVLEFVRLPGGAGLNGAPASHAIAVLFAIACGLGISSSCVSIWVGSAEPLSSTSGRMALATLLFPVYLFVKRIALVSVMTAGPASYDRLLTLLDRAIGVDVSFVTGQTLLAHPALRDLAIVAYQLLPVAIALTFAFRRQRLGPRAGAKILIATAMAGSLAFISYVIVPAAGPSFEWSGFPWSIPKRVDPFPAPLPGTFLNAMPSVHFTCALFILFDLWNLGVRPRIIGFAFACATALATVGLGEHYAFDLIVAVPFAVAVRDAVYKEGASRVTAVCAVMTAAWLFSMRFAGSLLLIRGVAPLSAGMTLVITVGLVRARKLDPSPDEVPRLVSRGRIIHDGADEVRRKAQLRSPDPTD